MALAAGCSERIVQLGPDGGGGNSTGGWSGGGGTPCVTPDGVRLCGGTQNQCGWVGNDQCPGGGCQKPYDSQLKGGVCYSDLADNGSRSCWGCSDGEVCLQRKQGDYICVPESVCADLWKMGVRGVCRYADLSAYDGRRVPRLSSCPNTDPTVGLCGGPCSSDCAGLPCTGRSPDHPQGYCFISQTPCALGPSGYIQGQGCAGYLPPRYCGVFHDKGADATIARQYLQCMGTDTCLALAKKLPGGFDCFDDAGNLVKP